MRLIIITKLLFPILNVLPDQIVKRSSSMGRQGRYTFSRLTTCISLSSVVVADVRVNELDFVLKCYLCQLKNENS